MQPQTAREYLPDKEQSDEHQMQGWCDQNQEHGCQYAYLWTKVWYNKDVIATLFRSPAWKRSIGLPPTVTIASNSLSKKGNGVVCRFEQSES